MTEPWNQQGHRPYGGGGESQGQQPFQQYPYPSLPPAPPQGGAQSAPQGYPPQQGYPQQGDPPQQGYPQQGDPPQGYPPSGYPPAQGNPAQQGYPPPQGNPPQAYPGQPMHPARSGYAPQGGYPGPGGYPGAVNYPVPVQPVMAVRQKSAATAGLLAFFFGPLGMLYSTWVGALTLFLVNIVLIWFTAGLILVLTLPIGVVWAVMATNEFNRRMLVAVPPITYR